MVEIAILHRYVCQIRGMGRGYGDCAPYITAIVMMSTLPFGGTGPVLMVAGNDTNNENGFQETARRCTIWAGRLHPRR